MGYINDQIGYYVGDRISINDLEVPEQPSQFHEYINNEWVLNINLKRMAMPALSARQVRLVLSQFGYRTQVESAIEQASQEVKDEWNFANEFERVSPVLNGMAQMLGLDDTDVDLMFEIGINL
jgi:hypothetical protein